MSMMAIVVLLLTQQPAAVPTELPLRLIGVLLADQDLDRAAVIRDERTGKYVTVREGGVVATAQVVHIYPGQVLLRTWGRLEFLASGTAWVERKSCDSLLSRRSELINSPNQARIVPAFRDGQPLGFKVFSVRPDSYASRIGIKNGDLVTGANGLPLRSPEDLLTAYSTLRCATQITFTVLRDGGEVSLALP